MKGGGTKEEDKERERERDNQTMLYRTLKQLPHLDTPLLPLAVLFVRELPSLLISKEVSTVATVHDPHLCQVLVIHCVEELIVHLLLSEDVVMVCFFKSTSP